METTFHIGILALFVGAVYGTTVSDTISCVDVSTFYQEGGCCDNPDSGTTLITLDDSVCDAVVGCAFQLDEDTTLINQVYNSSAVLGITTVPSTASFFQNTVNATAYGLQQNWVDFVDAGNCYVSTLRVVTSSSSLLIDPVDANDRASVKGLGHTFRYEFVTTDGQQGFENVINSTTARSFDFRTTDETLGADYFFDFSMYPSLQAVTIVPSVTGELTDFTSDSIHTLSILTTLIYVKIESTSISNLTGFLDDLSTNNLNLQHLEVVTCVPQAISSPPDSLGSLSMLQYLRLADNNFGGDLQWLNGLTNLEFLDLSLNVFNDDIPSSVFSNPLTMGIDFQGNVNVTGVIPASFASSVREADLRQTSIILLMDDTDPLCDAPRFYPNDLFACEEATVGQSCGGVDCCDEDGTKSTFGYQAGYGGNYGSLTVDVEISVSNPSSVQVFSDLLRDAINNNAPEQILYRSYLSRLKDYCFLSRYDFSNGFISLPSSLSQSQAGLVAWIKCETVTAPDLINDIFSNSKWIGFQDVVIELTSQVDMTLGSFVSAHAMILDGGYGGSPVQVISNLDSRIGAALRYLKVSNRQSFDEVIPSLDASASNLQALLIDNIEEESLATMAFLDFTGPGANVWEDTLKFVEISNLWASVPTAPIDIDVPRGSEWVRLVNLRNATLRHELTFTFSPENVTITTVYPEDAFRLRLNFGNDKPAHAFDFRGYAIDGSNALTPDWSSPSFRFEIGQQYCDPTGVEDPENSYLPDSLCVLPSSGPWQECFHLRCYDYSYEEILHATIASDFTTAVPAVSISFPEAMGYIFVPDDLLTGVIYTSEFPEFPTQDNIYGRAVARQPKGKREMYKTTSTYRPVVVVSGDEAYNGNVTTDFREDNWLRVLALEFDDVCNTTLISQMIELWDPFVVAFNYSVSASCDPIDSFEEIGIQTERLYGFAVNGPGSKPFTQNFFDFFFGQAPLAYLRLQDISVITQAHMSFIISQTEGGTDRLIHVHIENVPGVQSDLLSELTYGLGQENSEIELINLGLSGITPPLQGLMIDLSNNSFTGSRPSLTGANTLSHVSFLGNPSYAYELSEFTYATTFGGPIKRLDIRDTAVEFSVFLNNAELCQSDVEFLTNGKAFFYTTSGFPIDCPFGEDPIPNSFTGVTATQSVAGETDLIFLYTLSINSPQSSRELIGVPAVDGILATRIKRSLAGPTAYYTVMREDGASTFITSWAHSTLPTAPRNAVAGKLTVSSGIYNTLVLYDSGSTSAPNIYVLDFDDGLNCTIVPVNASNTGIIEAVATDVSGDSIDDLCYVYRNTNDGQHYLDCVINPGPDLICSGTTQTVQLPYEADSVAVLPKGSGNFDICVFTRVSQLISVPVISGVVQTPMNKTTQVCDGGGPGFYSDMKVGDMDNDGNVDLVIWCRSTAPMPHEYEVFIVWGEGSGVYGEEVYRRTFSNTFSMQTTYDHNPLRLLDFNGDGLLDVYMETNLETGNVRPLLLYNTGSRTLGVTRTLNPLGNFDMIFPIKEVDDEYLELFAADFGDLPDALAVASLKYA